MRKEISEIKRRALLAKQRLKMGYWQRMQEEAARMSRETADISKLELANAIRKEEFERRNNVALGDDFAEKEERLYVKVREILDHDENVINPIGQLVDRNVYEKLDEANKQRYILELSSKFRNLRDRYYKEKTKYV